MQRGSLKRIKLRGVNYWRGQWRENGHGRSKLFGRCSDVKRADAQAELKKVLGADNRVALPRAGQSLREYVERFYLVQRSRKWKASTASTTERAIQLYILRDLGSGMLATFTRIDLQDHLDQLAAAGLSASVVNGVRFQMNAIFELAEGDGMISHNPTKGLTLPTIQKDSDRRVISLQQIKAALGVLEVRERLIFELAVYQGMRPGEIVGLQIGDYDGDALAIRRRIYEGKQDTPKTRRGDRDVPLIRQTKLLFDAYLNIRPGARSADSWLFPSETGITPLSYSNVWQDRIRPALEKIGLGFVNYQILRRTWVTEFAAVEKDPHVRAQLAGHSVDVSENQYRQGKPDRLRESMDKWGDRLQ